MSWAIKTEVFEEEHKDNVIKEEECARKDALEETKKAAGEDDEVLYPNHMVVVKEEASAAAKTEMVEVKEAGFGLGVKMEPGAADPLCQNDVQFYVEEPVKRSNGTARPMAMSAKLKAIVAGGFMKRAQSYSLGYGEMLTRCEIVKRLWFYIRTKNLQDPADKQFFTPDEVMAPVFGTKRIRAFGMAKYLKNHLS